MQVKEALQIRPGDRVGTGECLFTVLSFPETKRNGSSPFVRISAADPRGRTMVFSHEELSLIHPNPKPILVKGEPNVPTRKKR